MIIGRAEAKKVQGRTYKDLDVPELGEGAQLKLVSLSAAAAMTASEFEARSKKGESIDREMMIFMLMNAVVDVDKQPLFEDEAAAADFLNRITDETIGTIVKNVPGLQKAATPGNSEAGPTAA